MWRSVETLGREWGGAGLAGGAQAGGGMGKIMEWEREWGEESERERKGKGEGKGGAGRKERGLRRREKPGRGRTKEDDGES